MKSDLAAAELMQLEALVGVPQPTLAEIAFAERSLIAAVLLVLLCFYATYSAPPAKKLLASKAR